MGCLGPIHPRSSEILSKARSKQNCSDQQVDQDPRDPPLTQICFKNNFRCSMLLIPRLIPKHSMYAIYAYIGVV